MHALRASAAAAEHEEARFQLDVAKVQQLDFQRHPQAPCVTAGRPGLLCRERSHGPLLQRPRPPSSSTPAPMGADQARVVRPEFFDRKVRAPQTALRPERGNRLADQVRDVVCVIAMDEGAEARQLGVDVGLIGQDGDAVAPCGPSGRRGIRQHAGVLQDERYLRTGAGEFGSARHLARQKPAGRTTSHSRPVGRHWPGQQARGTGRDRQRSGRAGFRASGTAGGRRAPCG